MNKNNIWTRMGRMLHERRVAMGLSIAELSVSTGISAHDMLCYESNTKGMTLENLIAVTVALNTDVLSLFKDIDFHEFKTAVSLDYRDRLT